ncbi:carbohydrate-binding protein [Vibrio alginolyticus]|uniref:carbohydrate-binding protein n=1 Tax=Vibrio TaxID=662 RepID=UPI000506AB6A|nr:MULTISPECIES: carbohydrate-binding protein [Vibrio]EGQ7905589.1 polysaccharide deacetylase family protein [Vibrio alginolyticus]EGQ9575402.1 polysaccharide deacetylase family protein [Vibrio alginolyticus]EGQ9764310.1 polysaccharide deacetylase family protein [Vibrio alginolyticus]EJG1640291.1 polysaccharide deacetylase family protein [Vibrio alginolyticus]EKA5862808.1 polysaccharide deacetylase family protein [Vibrio alginolyticus]
MKFNKLAIATLVSAALSQHSFAQTDSKGTIYLTFDDGPINASIDVIQVLNQEDIKATFYFNAWHLDGIGDENEDRSLEALKLALDTGHIVANHSYDHMVHNCVDEFGPNSAAECNATGDHQLNSYQDPVYDASMFTENLSVLAKYLPNITSYPNYKATEFARLPYTNGWRVTKDFKADGLCATSDDLKPWEPGYVCDTSNPSNSVKAAIEVQNILANNGYQTHGWDVDWAPENWGIEMPANSLTEAEAFLGYVDSALNTCAPTTINPINSKAQEFPCGTPLHADKVIVLTHEFLFEDGKRGMGATQNLPKLAKFIQLAKQAGYDFDTMDNYTPNWQVGHNYDAGDYVLHLGTVYQAVTNHTAQQDWAPSLTSSLWTNADPATNWTQNVSYKQGDVVTYQGLRYLVDVPHVSQADWTPNTQNTLFTAL